MAATTTTLPTLLSTKPILLVYAIPLLVISIFVTFSGSFFILDRSYSFSPRHGRSDKYLYPYDYEDEDASLPYASFEQERERGWFWWWRLEAGIGGLAVGYLFGLHLTTFLFLLFPVLSPPAFLSICIISSALLSLVSARFKAAAFLFSSLSSSLLTSLVLSLILHPPLLGRYIILGIVSSLITIPTVVVGILSTYFRPSPAKSANLTHIFLRITTTTTGAFSFLLAVSLLPNPPLSSWSNAYSRLYISDGVGWGTAQEKGFIAAWVFFAALGYIEDWALKRWLGQNPDEKWDEYLDWYVREMPYDNAAGKREGHWKPLPGFWEKISRVWTTTSSRKEDQKKLNPLLFCDEEQLQDPPPLSLLPATKRTGTVDEDGTDDDDGDGDGDYTLPPFVTKRRKKDHFAKLRAQLKGQSKKSVGFRPATSSRDEFDDHGSSSSATLVASRGTCGTDSGVEKNREREKKNDYNSYFDVEVDLTAMAGADLGLGGKKRPKFMHRHMSRRKQTDATTTTRDGNNKARALFVAASPTRISLSQPPPTPPLTPPVPQSVPATPSLLQAIKRVEAARQQAHYNYSYYNYYTTAGGNMPGLPSSPSNEKEADDDDDDDDDAPDVDGLPVGIKDNDGWADFWTEVRSKAKSPMR